IRIATHLLEFAHAKFMDGIRQRDTHSSEILMVACSLNLHGLSVQEKTVVGIETNRAHAKRRRELVNDLAIEIYAASELVKIGSFAGPKTCLGQCNGLLQINRAVKSNFPPRALRGDSCAPSIENFAQEFNAAIGRGFILNGAIDR